MRRPRTRPAPPAGRAALVLIAAAGSAGMVACGSTSGTSGTAGTEMGRSDAPPAGDCAGERSGPTAVVGMDTATGDERWSRTVGTMMDSFEAGGVLVVTSFEGEAIGIDPATGAAQWCRPGTGPVDTTASPSGTISTSSGTTVVTLGPSDTLVAYDARTGQDLWSTPVPETITALPQIRGDRVLVVENVIDASVAGGPADATHPVVATVDLATGTSVGGPAGVPIGQTGSSASTGEVLVAVGPGPEPATMTVAVSDAATGAERWHLTRPGVAAQAVGDLVVVIDQEPTPGGEWMAVDVLTAYAADDGTERWTARMDAPFPYVVGAGDLLMWSSGAEAVAIDNAGGQVRWRADHGSPGRGGDRSEPGRYTTFVTSADGQVVAGVITAEEPYRD